MYVFRADQVEFADLSIRDIVYYHWRKLILPSSVVIVIDLDVELCEHWHGRRIDQYRNDVNLLNKILKILN